MHIKIKKVRQYHVIEHSGQICIVKIDEIVDGEN